MAVSIGRRAVVPLVLALVASPACSADRTAGHGSALGSPAADTTQPTTSTPTHRASATHKAPRRPEPGKPQTHAAHTAPTAPTIAPTTTPPPTTKPLSTTAPPTTSPPTTKPAQTAPPQTQSSAPPAKPQHTLEFDLTGDGVLTTMTYVVNGQSTTLHSVHMPWHKSFPLTNSSGHNSWSLHTQQASGSVFSKVLLDGQVWSQGSGEGPGSGDLSGSV